MTMTMTRDRVGANRKEMGSFHFSFGLINYFLLTLDMRFGPVLLVSFALFTLINVFSAVLNLDPISLTGKSEVLSKFSLSF